MGITRLRLQEWVSGEKRKKPNWQRTPSYVGSKGAMRVTDDELRESIEQNQLKLQKQRGTDLTIFSPRASWMAHHVGNEHTSKYWD